MCHPLFELFRSLALDPLEASFASLVRPKSFVFPSPILLRSYLSIPRLKNPTEILCFCCGVILRHQLHSSPSLNAGRVVPFPPPSVPFQILNSPFFYFLFFFCPWILATIHTLFYTRCFSSGVDERKKGIEVCVGFCGTEKVFRFNIMSNSSQANFGSLSFFFSQSVL